MSRQYTGPLVVAVFVVLALLAPARSVAADDGPGFVDGTRLIDALGDDNVLVESPAAVWNGERMRRVRQRIRRELLPGCIRCGWLNYNE